MTWVWQTEAHSCENGLVNTLPSFLLVKQNFPDLRLKDIRESVHGELEASRICRPALVPEDAKSPSAWVAAGSPISPLIVKSAVDFFAQKGLRPFLVPAMGSHGGATAEGQRQVLERYGIDESTMGCPVVCEMDVVPTGVTESGIAAFASKAAMASDGIMLINRVKWHTSFQGTIESGVAKMIAIGLGKIDGARSCHLHARSQGLEKVIRSVAQQNLATGKILGGLAIMEDASHHTAQVAAMKAANLIEEEERLLEIVRSWKGSIPVPLDILILDEIGKDISGTGMDTKVVNRTTEGRYNPWPGHPRIGRIYLRDLSAATHGNAVGIGMADMVHDRLVAKVDPESTLVNAVTSGSLAIVRTPAHFASDRKCIETLGKTVGKEELSEVTIGWIRNSLELGMLALTENLRGLIEENPALEILGPASPLDFDREGNAVVSPYAAVAVR